METWLLPFVGALAGYFGHWLQEALNRKYGRKALDRERAIAMCVELRALIRYNAEDYARDGRARLDGVKNDAALLHHKKLRERVLFDCGRAEAWGVAAKWSSRGEVWHAFLSDAIDCLTSVARGDRVPELSDEAAWLDTLIQHRSSELATTVLESATAVMEMGADPDFEELAFDEWRRERHARRGWRRLIPRRGASR